MEDDNSYQVFSLSDPTYLTTLKALLIRLDADTFFTNYYETLDPRITTDF